jgi:hypothetical protein
MQAGSVSTAETSSSVEKRFLRPCIACIAQPGAAAAGLQLGNLVQAAATLTQNLPIKSFLIRKKNAALGTLWKSDA